MTDRTSADALSPQQFQILLALADDDRHGYGIILEVADRTGGALRLGTGALYTAIARLAANGLIRETAQRDPDDSRRRYYTLTRPGRAALEAEVDRLRRMVVDAQLKGVRPAARKVRP